MDTSRALNFYIMKKTMNYRGKEILIKVMLNHSSERHPGGDQFHHVHVIEEKTDGYHEMYKIPTTENLPKKLEEIENQTRKDIDNILDGSKSELEIELNNLGYQ